MGAKKDKKAKADKKARVALKQEKKSAKKEKKGKGQKDVDSDAEDVDLDQILAEYAKKQEEFLKVTEDPCDPPSARSSSTLVGSPANDNELFLFGGEYFNGAVALFFNDLFAYNIKNDQWKLITSPNTPLPRSGHACTRGGNAGGVYLFGGEFSSPRQGTFYHYNDFWRLDPASREWTKLETKGKGPPARSGHRLTYYKNYIVLFGGFQDTSQQTKYLNDLWLYDCQNFTWHNPALPAASQKPDARSSFTFLPHESGAVLYGGYSRIKASQAVRSTKGGGTMTHTIYKPVIHQDTWFLKISQPPADAGGSTPPSVRWERRKRPANAPNPPRCGATMAAHRGRGIQFGGVHDVEESEEGMDSEFFNTLYVWNVDRNRFFPLVLRRPKAGQKRQAPAVERSKRGRGKADEEELLRNLAALDAKDVEDVKQEAAGPKTDYKEPDEPQREQIVMWEMPHVRFNAPLTVQDDVLYIYGGTFEKGDREYTFDEMWSIDLGKLDGAKQVFKRELEDWAGSDRDASSEDEEDEDDDDDDEDDETLIDTEETRMDLDDVTLVSSPNLAADKTELEIEEDTGSALADALPHPRPFESLKDFFARTSIEWQELTMKDMDKAEQSGKSIKEVRKDAFERAEQKWWDCREEIAALEDEQEAAGIGEVVNLAEKQAGATAGAGRRR